MSRTTAKLITLINGARLRLPSEHDWCLFVWLKYMLQILDTFDMGANVEHRKARKLSTQHHYTSHCAAVEAAEYVESGREQHTKMKSMYLGKGGQHSNRNENSNKMIMAQGKQMKQNWIPHPRSGIYFREGHDWVMNDVSENAASLGQSHSVWLRNNIHGADKHDPNRLSADDYFITSTSDHIFD